MKVGRVIGAAHKRTGSNVRETFRACDFAIGIESFRRDKLHNRQMLRRRAQILAKRQNLTADLAQIVHCLEKFRLGFAEAKHEAAFRHDLWRQLLCALQDLKRGLDILRAT